MKNKFTKVLGMALTVAILTSMMVPLVPALANVSQPTITVSPVVVGNNATYDVRFAVTRQLTQNGSITITLPSGTGVFDGNVTGNCTITASPGLMGGALSDANVTGSQFTGDNASHRIVIGLNSTGNQIGEGAQIRVVLGSGVMRNPSATGSYTLTVSTSNETTAITSDVYKIILPSFQPLPGIVTGKNSAGQVLTQAITRNINTVIDVPGVTTVEVTAGTYNVTVFPRANQTIIATGAAGSVILTSGTPNLPAVSIMADNVTLDGFTISPAIPEGQTAVIISGDNATIRNVTFNKGDYQLGVAAENPKTGTTIDNCIFNVTDNVTIGLLALSTTLVNNCTFNVDTDGAGIVTGGNVTLAGSRFFGAGNTGSGIYVTSGTSTISSSNFNTMGNDVLAVSGNATLKVTGSTITGSGLTAASENSGVITAYGGNLILVDNIIRNSSPANYALHISGGNVTASYNNITGNALNVRQTDGLANITHNWWGSTTGPTAASMNGTVSYAPFLNASVTGGQIALNADNLSERTSPVGVEVTCTNATTGNPVVAGIIAAAKYATNPVSSNPTGTPIAYYDVYVSQPAIGATITLKFFDPGVTDRTSVYFVDTSGTWSPIDTWGVNVTGGFAYTTLTDTSRPAIKDLAGTIFAISDVFRPSPHPPPPAQPQPPPAPNLTGPANGATAVTTDTGFGWIRITDAFYDFQLSTSPTFATLTSNVSRLVSSTFGLAEPLAVSTTYFWRVRATMGNLTGPWMSATFTTAATVAPQVYVPKGPIEIRPPSPRLTINTTGLGFAKGAGIYEPGSTVTVTANPEPGWQFAGWTGDTVADAGAGTTTILMNGDKSITANFVVIPSPATNTTSPELPSGNTTPPTTPPASLPLWPFIGLGAAIVLTALILVIKRKRP
ncbi:MAG: hypothetical protein Q7J73_03300 [Dehalococcoidales bacterium]|nr:hypothetical protein [Dehalococcoidales bacterium]